MKTLFINYDMETICKKVLQEQLDKMELKYSIRSSREVEIVETISNTKMKQLNVALKRCSMEIVEDHKSIMVQKIKDAIVEMVFMEEKLPVKTSTYLSGKFQYSYNYISNIFSNATYISIEDFVLMQKIEWAKYLLTANELNITEIGYKLNYSSTAHFSNQFKNVTGLTPSAFRRIIIKRTEAKFAKY